MVALPVMSLREQDVCLWAVSKLRNTNIRRQHTNVEQNCAVFLLLDNVVLKNLVVQGLRGFHCRRHGGYARFAGIYMRGNWGYNGAKAR